MALVKVPSLAKLNLDLRVLHKRPDGYHELRTIFQTISLGDDLAIDFNFAKRTQFDLQSSIQIADNLLIRAGLAVLEHLKVRAAVRFVIRKRIPMGAGLGGGSSNAAAVLIALPALAGRRLRLNELLALGESLGSDVPFFLHGGTALGVGRGTELYPLPEQPEYAVVVVSTGIHVSTAEAYRALGRNSIVTNALTSPPDSPILGEFQGIAWNLHRSNLHDLPLQNDFEGPVFELHRELAASVRKLRRLGAQPALMTGSGSAVFGIFPDAKAARRAAENFPDGSAYVTRFVSRRRYRALWQRALGPAAEVSCFS